MFENFNLVKSNDKTNPTVNAFSLWEKYSRGLTFYGQYTIETEKENSNQPARIRAGCSGSFLFTYIIKYFFS